MLSVPADLMDELMKKVPVWMERIQGKPEEGTIFIKNFKADQLWPILKYIIKGVDPECIDGLGLRCKTRDLI